MTQELQVKEIHTGRRSAILNYLPFWFATLIAVTSLVLALNSADVVEGLTKEGGAIEKASAFLWAYAAVVFVWLSPKQLLWQRWHVPVLFLLFAARELDFDKKFLSQGILKARLYSGDAPVTEKLIGLTVIVLILVVAIRLVRRNWRDLVHGLQHGVAWVWTVAVAFGLAGLSKTIDGAGRKLAPLGVEISPALGTGLSVVEETMELGFVVVTILAVCLYEQNRSEQTDAHTLKSPG